VFGLYRNRYTDDFSVRHLVYNIGNTHMVLTIIRRLVVKEDLPSSAVDPDTLQTLGTHTNKSKGQLQSLYTLGRKMKSPAFITDPNYDPESEK
jgi:hypothetical protein